MKEPFFNLDLLNQDTNPTHSLVYHLGALKGELITPEMVVKKANDWLKQAQERPVPSQILAISGLRESFAYSFLTLI